MSRRSNAGPPARLSPSAAAGALTSLLGVGGGLLISPFLTISMHYDARKAAGANSFIVTISSVVGTGGHFVLGQPDYVLIAVTTAACLIGSYVGAHVTVRASPSFVKIAFAFIMWFFATHIALQLLGVTGGHAG